MELEKRIITVHGLDYKDGNTEGRSWRRFIIKDEHDLEYSFFSTKADGTDSVAYQAVKKGKVNLFQQIGVAYEVTKRDDVNKKGKTVTYINRRIAFFYPANPEEEHGKGTKATIPYTE